MKRILFVDDEQNVLDGIRRMLYSARRQWEIEFVNSGEAAMLACRHHAFDVVVSDLRMPGTDGATLLGQIREEFPATARIVLSGYSEATLTARAVPVAYRILSKPCNEVELKHTIERVCTLQDVLCTPALREMIGKIGELPSLSSSYLALSEALKDPDAPISAIAKIIERDLAMSAKILQLVNSGFFSLTRTVNSIQQAVNLLGLDTIKHLALCSETFRLFLPDPRIGKSFYSDIQRHSDQSATVIAALPLTRAVREVALLAALLHDVGSLLLASEMPEEFSIVLADMKQYGRSQAEAEEALLGISHAEVGAYLLGLWGINDIAVEAIAHHHHPTRISHVGMDCSAAVYLADLLTQELECHPSDPEGKELREVDRNQLEVLGLLQEYASYRSGALALLASRCRRIDF